ncbi:MAG: amidohydrolase [Alphaproteobacteria bacterium]|jgi:amidohydrolase|nr:amidohydrolase [Alphaproteobacteria bacterium]
MPIINSIAALEEQMTEWRRDFHMHPELAYQEVRTSGKVAELLESWGIEVTTGLGKTGVVGVIKGSGDGPSIGLRADMDALPIDEMNDTPWKSQNAGVMHACGHDGHTTMLLGAAKYLAETRNFNGTVNVIFQPAEEGYAGAKAMMDDGLFEKFPCDQVYGLHNWPQMPAGSIAAVPGPIMAAADKFDITVRGKGAHGAMPQNGVDPIVIGSQIVTALQSLVSRSKDPIETAVISITMFHAGAAFNVIPEEAVLSGTVRTFNPEVQDLIEAGMKRIAEGIASGMGGSAEVDFRRGYPATVNHEAQTQLAADVAGGIVGPENVRNDVDPTMGGEDFAFMLNEKPGCYLWLGQGGGASSENVHHPQYDFNDSVLPIGASVLARLVEELQPKR